MTDRRTGETRRAALASGRQRLSRRLRGPLAASALLMSVQAWSATPAVQQQLATSSVANPAGARLNATPHPDVPLTLDAMWYAPAEKTLAEESDLARLARGIRDARRER